MKVSRITSSERNSDGHVDDQTLAKICSSTDELFVEASFAHLAECIECNERFVENFYEPVTAEAKAVALREVLDAARKPLAEQRFEVIEDFDELKDEDLIVTIESPDATGIVGVAGITMHERRLNIRALGQVVLQNRRSRRETLVLGMVVRPAERDTVFLAHSSLKKELEHRLTLLGATVTDISIRTKSELLRRPARRALVLQLLRNMSVVRELAQFGRNPISGTTPTRKDMKTLKGILRDFVTSFIEWLTGLGTSGTDQNADDFDGIGLA